MTEALREQLNSLPDKPGSYRFLDAGGKVLYVGKAASLRSRVRTYFMASGPKGRSSWIDRMVPRVASVDVLITNTPLEALLLELNLIKQYRPPFNSRLTDDKHYPYLCLTWADDFPRLVVVRRVQRDGNRYFGPYSSSRAMRSALDTIRRTLGIRTCKLNIREGDAQEPCLEYHLGYCPAPCAGFIRRSEYRALMQDVARFLDGHADRVVRELRRDMQSAAERQQYERAALLRDRIRAIEEVTSAQAAISTGQHDLDAIGLCSSEDKDSATVSLLLVRAGRLIDQQAFTLRNTVGWSPAELLGEFITQHYYRAAFIPRQILLPHIPPDAELIAQWLSTRRGAKVELAAPRRGEKRRLVALAADNAEAAATRAAEVELIEQERGRARSQALQEALKLPATPRRIECFDISTLQGRESVGSMVVFLEGRPAPSDYRSFRIKREVGRSDDYAMMQEVLDRRFSALNAGAEGFSARPDLVVVDGGKGQLACAMAVLEAHGLDVPSIALAKRLEEVFRPGFDESLRLEPTDEALKLLMHLRDEAHRFAVAHHRTRRAKAATRSVLDDIRGIGPKRKQALLAHFPSIRALTDATIDEIAAVPGVTTKLAQEIHRQLRPHASTGLRRTRASR